MPAGFDNGPRLLVAVNPAIRKRLLNHHRGLLTRLAGPPVPWSVGRTAVPGLARVVRPLVDTLFLRHIPLLTSVHGEQPLRHGQLRGLGRVRRGGLRRWQTKRGWRRMPPSPSCPPTRQAGRISKPCSARVAIRSGVSASGTRCGPVSLGLVSRRGTRAAAPHADRLRAPGVGHEQRPRRLPRRRARRLVRGRAALRLPAPAAQVPRPLGGSVRG
jgi:hypothetical protein